MLQPEREIPHVVRHVGEEVRAAGVAGWEGQVREGKGQGLVGGVVVGAGVGGEGEGVGERRGRSVRV